jgi:glycosyltransferase involved in cell wall biosynthesis
VRILYDGQIFRMQTAGGINRYFANIIGSLPHQFHPTLLVDRIRHVNYPSHPNLKLYHLGKHRFDNFSYRLSLYFSRIEDAVLLRRIQNQGFDVFHPTYYTLLTDLEVTTYGPPAVITVWDMIHELFPKEMDPTGQCAEEKRRAIMSAQRIICISESTKRDLLEKYPVREERVSVTYLAAEIHAGMSHGPEPVPERPYYIYVGSRSSYKNFDGLLRALAKVVPGKKDLALCVVGTPFTDDENKLIKELNLVENVRHYEHPTDSHLAKLYRCSLGLVYPSLYEGFGIPPLEAMACETVAVVSNVSSIPEVVGEAGLMFDPKSQDQLIDILRSLPENEKLRAEMISKGKQRVKEFSWNKTVAQTLEVYQSV